MWYKVIDEKLVPPPVNFITPEGATICNFNLSPALMTKYGWSDWTPEEEAQWREEHPEPPPPPRTVCTKYELVSALQAHFPELLAELREAYAASAELQFFWNTVNDLDRNNADFQRFAASLGISEAQIDAIFAALEA